MTQSDLNRQIARATGETIGCIRQRGFSLLDEDDSPRDHEDDHPTPQWVDWDEVDRIHAGG